MKKDRTFSADEVERPRSTFFRSRDEATTDPDGDAWDAEFDPDAAADADAVDAADLVDVEPLADDPSEPAEPRFNDGSYARDDFGTAFDGAFEQMFDPGEAAVGATDADPDVGGADDNWDATEPEPRRARRFESPPRTHDGSAAGVLSLLFGGTACIGGVALGVLSVLAPAAVRAITAVTDAVGATPATLLLLGGVAVSHGLLVRRARAREREAELRLSRLDRHLDRVATQRPEVPEQSDEGIAELLDHAQRALLALERQDEKIANLTRATKMYGKPLIEISKQVAELTNQIGDMAGSDSRIDELATTLTSIDETSAGRLAEILGATTRLALGVDAVPSAIEDTLAERLEGLTRQVEALGARVETAVRDGLAALPAPAAPVDAPPVDLGPVQALVESIQREVQGIATRVTQLANAPRAKVATASPTPQSAATPPAEPSATPPADGAGPAHRIAGAHSAKGSNVLGAIAKLRSMKGS
ncbi:MAG: hypothetical protein IPM29_22545 [Planctomycetes bacterium]|nr:hypothetical protein [Planctomycetota bacterium]